MAQFQLTHKIVGQALDDTIKKFRSELQKEAYPDQKLQWIKKMAIDILETLETEGKKFNSNSDTVKIVGNDFVSAITAALNVVLKNLAIKPKKN